MPSIGSRKTSRSKAKRDLVAAFSYFKTPDVLGGTGEFTLALDAATSRLEAAWRCKTWGAFADLFGLTWSEFVKEWHDEILEITKNDPRAATPFVFSELWGIYAVVDVIRDPRACAHDFLRANVPSKILDDPRLDGLLEWGGSSPGGNIDIVTSPSADGFVLLEKVLHGAGFTGLSLQQVVNPLTFLDER